MPKSPKTADKTAEAKASNSEHKIGPRVEPAPPLVGIGASAGGLEALESFFSHMPPDSGLAFVVIQHLDPDYKGMMTELLQRTTQMRVVQAADRMRIRANNIYIIPPSKYLSVVGRMLYLVEPQGPRTPRLAVDYFFRTLAEELREKAIGVVLSGMGSDGTLGLRAIKEHAGLALVQDPATAKFDGMPRSAISAGLADMVLAPQELPGKIIAYIRHLPEEGQALPHPFSGTPKSSLDKIFALLQGHTGHDFSHYKKSTVYRRIERRMGLYQIGKIGDYVRYLNENPQELNLLFKELLIGVTNFFRDPESWAVLEDQVMVEVLGNTPSGKALRAWVAGCSTGEEAYSLAMVFKESLEKLKPRGRYSLQIFATDLDPDAIERARLGFYPGNIEADVSPERLARFFVEEGQGYRICKEIREMVVFAPQNVIMDPPFTKLDILCCRNLLIYFSAELQKKLLPLFNYALNPGGILFLGSAETIGSFTELFTPLEAKARLFRRNISPRGTIDIDFPSRFHPAPIIVGDDAKRPVGEGVNLQALADQSLLRRFAPAAVLVNAEGDILYINGRTGKYLEPAAGKANWNVYAMAREGLREELVLTLPKALRNGEQVASRQLRIGNGTDAQTVDLMIQPIDEPAALAGMAMIVFTEVPTLPEEPATGRMRKPARGSRVSELERALQQAREETQAIREEMQTSREELKSTNEELQSTNEELQSTNEELTTSKEEMQSLNEELQTVNIELQSKVDELSAANNDMKNLLNSTDIATVFLDNGLCIRRFTTQATRIFKLIPTDVGRPLSDIVTDLDYPDLQHDAREVLNSLVFCEKQVLAGDGRWFMVKILPYRTLDNVIDGVVITFTDISVLKRLQDEVRRGHARAAPDDGANQSGSSLSKE